MCCWIDSAKSARCPKPPPVVSITRLRVASAWRKEISCSRQNSTTTRSSYSAKICELIKKKKTKLIKQTEFWLVSLPLRAAYWMNAKMDAVYGRDVYRRFIYNNVLLTFTACLRTPSQFISRGICVWRTEKNSNCNNYSLLLFSLFANYYWKCVTVNRWLIENNASLYQWSLNQVLYWNDSIYYTLFFFTRLHNL